MLLLFSNQASVISEKYTENIHPLNYSIIRAWVNKTIFFSSTYYSAYNKVQVHIINTIYIRDDGNGSEENVESQLPLRSVSLL